MNTGQNYDSDRFFLIAFWGKDMLTLLQNLSKTYGLYRQTNFAIALQYPVMRTMHLICLR